MRHYMQMYRNSNARLCMAWYSVNDKMAYLQMNVPRQIYRQPLLLSIECDDMDDYQSMKRLELLVIDNGYHPVNTKPKIVNVLLSQHVQSRSHVSHINITAANNEDVDKFANQVEYAYDEDTQQMDWQLYYTMRDGFIQQNEFKMRRGELSVDDFAKQFLVKPCIADKRIMSVIEATAESYLNRYDLPVPDWCFENKCSEENPIFVWRAFTPYELEMVIDNTPVEFRKRNIFCGHNMLKYR